MDKRHKEITVNQSIAEHVNSLMRRSNNSALFLSTVLTLAFVAALTYSNNQLKNASGVFEIPIDNQNIVISEPIVDSAHFFDDNITRVQSFVSLKLYQLFNHTSTNLDAQYHLVRELSVDTFELDVKTNLANFGILKHLTDENGVTSIEFKLNSVPMVVNAFTFDGTSYTEIELDKLNTTRISQWTVDIAAKVNFKDSNGRIRRSPNIRFRVDVKDPTGLGSRAAFRFATMSTWKVY
ncbi:MULTISPECIES: hypothetical protein [Vibrio]|uniref:hypothetical protein n=1 Tax=Vibrio TaxID=662 RepID=UPI0004DF6752|nr:hypothetical protein [Vibrio parahaemolyticus]EGQ9239461.1 hypothetical protein [Vibrio vulnificus]EHD1698103.1 hypothetical protein [Vibrio vulnificus]EKZ9225832.1 hypothetical protein [Vibrio vulnificus]ELC9582674.1 hypothetical protein [Vibrio vulnificus]MCU8149789.1 hypothetical protein [Vibrio vulnificus]